MKVNEMITNKVIEVLKNKADNGDKDAIFLVSVIEETNNGKEAVKKINKEKFDSVLERLDIEFEIDMKNITLRDMVNMYLAN